jgi:hypothetical protein
MDDLIERRKQYDVIWRTLKEVLNGQLTEGKAYETIEELENSLEDNEYKHLFMLCVSFCCLKHTMEELEEMDLEDKI